MFRQYIEMAFLTKTGQEWLDGAPKRRDSLIGIYCTHSFVDEKHQQLTVYATIDRKPCRDIAEICKNAFVRLATEGAPILEVPHRVITGLLDFQKAFSSKPFTIPEYIKTLKDVDENLIRMQMRGR